MLGNSLKRGLGDQVGRADHWGGQRVHTPWIMSNFGPTFFSKVWTLLSEISFCFWDTITPSDVTERLLRDSLVARIGACRALDRVRFPVSEFSFFFLGPVWLPLLTFLSLTNLQPTSNALHGLRIPWGVRTLEKMLFWLAFAYFILPFTVYLFVPFFIHRRSVLTRKTVTILVLGDLGHSPRMCYHALSFANLGFQRQFGVFILKQHHPQQSSRMSGSMCILFKWSITAKNYLIWHLR